MNLAKRAKEIKKTYDFLDKFDLTNYIDKFKNQPVHDLMNFLEDELEHKLEFPTYLFNWITTTEFAEYLRDKYDAHIYEVLTLY